MVCVVGSKKLIGIKGKMRLMCLLGFKERRKRKKALRTEFLQKKKSLKKNVDAKCWKEINKTKMKYCLLIRPNYHDNSNHTPVASLDPSPNKTAFYQAYIIYSPYLVFLTFV